MNLVGLPPNLIAANVWLAGIVSSLLAAITSVIVLIPGLRPSDSTRNVLMRVLVGALNLAALVGYAWISGTVIPKEAIPALLAAVGLISVGGGHLVYKGMQSGQKALVSSGVVATTLVASTAPLQSIGSSIGSSLATPAGPGDTVLPFNAPMTTYPNPAPAATASTPTSVTAGGTVQGADLTPTVNVNSVGQ